jgi:hypothetical protein
MAKGLRPIKGDGWFHPVWGGTGIRDHSANQDMVIAQEVDRPRFDLTVWNCSDFLGGP